MSNLDPEGFTLRQAAQARDDFAQVMDGLGFVEAQPARLPTRRDQAFAPLKIIRIGRHRRRTRHSLVGRILAAFPLRAGRRGCLAAVVVALLLNTVGLVSDSQMQPAADPNNGLLSWLAGLGLSVYLWVKFPRLMIITARYLLDLSF